MNKDILLEEIRKVELAVNLAEQDGGIDCSLADDVWYLIDCINNLVEPEVLSQKMADELKRYKGLGYSLKDLLVIAGSKQEQEKLARAWLDGYEVAEEPKFYVLDKEDATLLKKTASQGVIKSIGMNIYNVKSCKDEEKYQLTEQEIKEYDKRFWSFAIKVEELGK